MESCKISVVCITYNQSKYIRKTLDSILSQKTKYPYEIIVHDDASTDGTDDIVREYQRRYPSIIVPILEKENQASQKKDFFADIVQNLARGEYVAFCEGDDYWTDDEKLQLQTEMLERHPECDMCACRALMVAEDGKTSLGEVRPRKGDGILSMEEVILGGGTYLATASIFFRKSMYHQMMGFEKIVSLDYAYQMKGALRGGICYIDRSMVAYRRYSKGSRTVVLMENAEVMKEQCEQEKEILRVLDRETGGRYHATIVERLRDYDESFYDQLERRKNEIFARIASLQGEMYLWGMGLRGRELERFCKDEGLRLSGVCDITAKDVGGMTKYGNPVVACTEVLEKADIIMASVTGAYEGVIKSGFHGTVLNMQEYMSRV